MIYYKELLEKNRIWSAEKIKTDPNYFKKMTGGQTPPILWIGCADSRVPQNEIIGAHPGEVFVHRNIANMVIHTDINMLSVLEYAVNTLKVKHIIVCGHYGCGGVKAALGKMQSGFLSKWIRHIKDIYRMYQKDLEAIKDEDERWDRLVELNVKEQVTDLGKTSIIQSAWKNKQEIMIHGWVYDIKTGLAKDLEVHMANADDIEEIYRIA
jgi:carbonic anhydrase